MWVGLCATIAAAQLLANNTIEEAVQTTKEPLSNSFKTLPEMLLGNKTRPTSAAGKIETQNVPRYYDFLYLPLAQGSSLPSSGRSSSHYFSQTVLAAICFAVLLLCFNLSVRVFLCIQILLVMYFCALPPLVFSDCLLLPGERSSSARWHHAWRCL